MSQTTPPQSLWSVTAEHPPLANLWEDVSCDVCVVGAGIAGLSVAYELARTGQKVVVLDRRGVGHGDTGVTTAHLSSALDDYFHSLERLHGLDGVRLAYESHQTAIERIAENVAREGIDCDLRRVDGYLFLDPDEDDDPKELDEELDGAHRAGFHDVERLDSAPAPFETGPCLRYPRQGRFHPLRYLAGLVAAIESAGGRVLCGDAQEVEGGARPRVSPRAGGGGSRWWSPQRAITDRLAIHPSRRPTSLAIAARLDQRADALWWDTRTYHYVRMQEPARARAARLGIVGGGPPPGGAGSEEERWERC